MQLLDNPFIDNIITQIVDRHNCTFVNEEKKRENTLLKI